jgi:hypothetical protein
LRQRLVQLALKGLRIYTGAQIVHASPKCDQAWLRVDGWRELLDQYILERRAADAKVKELCWGGKCGMYARCPSFTEGIVGTNPNRVGCTERGVHRRTRRHDLITPYPPQCSGSDEQPND